MRSCKKPKDHRMKVFQCRSCQSPLFFENTSCLNCGLPLGYLSTSGRLIPLKEKDGQWAAVPDDGRLYRYCNNFQYQVCNWLVGPDSEQEFCEACRLNHTIPDLSKTDNLLAWYQLEKAKHRLIYGLQQLGLPIISKQEDPERGLAFDFLSPADKELTGEQVQTGHLNGLITINLEEADSVHREWIRRKMSEPYRTLIGHFRHEVGHHYWDLLIKDQDQPLAAFRALFGDETKDYQQALNEYYKNGAPANWQEHYISQYATSHAWEDWAETWAHYLHIMDTVETGCAFGLSIHPRVINQPMLEVQDALDPYVEADFERIISAFVPMTFAINSFNRGMGIADVYPFVIAPRVKEKLIFIHQLVFAQQDRQQQNDGIR